jgi:hypothetical protein
MSDSNVVTSDADTSANLWVGYLVGVDSVYAWVDIERAAGCVNAAS